MSSGVWIIFAKVLECTMNTDLRDELRAYFDAMAADDVAGHEIERPARSHNRRNLAIVSVAVVAVLVSAIAILGVRDRGVTHVEPMGPPTAEPTSPAAGPTSSADGPPTSEGPSATPWDLKWTQIADLGYTGGSATALVIDGELLVVETGEPAGSAEGRGIRVGLDGNNTRPIADSPLTGRAGSSLVWTGTELFVLGGSNGTQIKLKPYGAAYDPAHDSWRVIPAPPDGVPPEVVWTGKALISWQMSSELEVTGSSWHSITPAPLTPRPEAAAIGVDNKLFVWGGCDPTRCSDFEGRAPAGSRDGAIYDPVSGKWTSLPPSPFESGNGATAAGRDDTVYVVANGSAQGGSAPFASYSLPTRTWTTLPTSPLTPRERARAVMLDSGSFVYSGYSDPRWFASPEIARFDPQTSSWSVGKLPKGGSLCSLTESGNQLIAVICGRTTTVHVATIS